MTAAPDGPDLARRAAQWCQLPWTEAIETTLCRFAAWLGEEAIPAGGLGAAEADRLWRRHIADSLLFASGWRDRDPPATVLDVGSGVGLPGIPLAVVWPDAAVTLLDRSGRRVDLAKRAVRVLGLGNVEVVAGDVERWTRPADLVTVRALADPAAAAELARPRCWTTGSVVLGFSHGGLEPPPAGGGEAEMITVPATVLDSPIRLLRMAGTAPRTAAS